MCVYIVIIFTNAQTYRVARAHEAREVGAGNVGGSPQGGVGLAAKDCAGEELVHSKRVRWSQHMRCQQLP